jgi:NDP-sugar pyrophosphorylase family protein
MQPLTFQMPKPVIPVLGRPLIQQVLAGLGSQGIREATVNLHHLPDSLVPLLSEMPAYGLERLHLSLEEDLILGTGGGIRHAAEHLRGDGTILVRNSDFLLDIELDEAIGFHRRSGRLVTLVLAGTRPGYTPVPVGRDGQVLSFGDLAAYHKNAVRAEGLFTGLHLMEEEVLDRIPGPAPCDIVRDVYLPMLAQGAIGAYMTDRFWWEFGSPEEYLEGSLRLMDLPVSQARRFCSTDPVKDFQGARVALGPGAVIAPEAILKGKVAIGMAAALAEHCLVEDSLILPEAWVGAGSSLRRCIVGPKAEIPAGTVLERKMVCIGGGDRNLPEGWERAGDLVLRPLDPNYSYE